MPFRPTFFATGMSAIDVVAPAETLGGLGQCPQFGLGDFGRRDRVLGEGGEAAVRVQENPVAPEQLDRAICARHDFVD